MKRKSDLKVMDTEMGFQSRSGRNNHFDIFLVACT